SLAPRHGLQTTGRTPFTRRPLGCAAVSGVRTQAAHRPALERHRARATAEIWLLLRLPHDESGNAQSGRARDPALLQFGRQGEKIGLGRDSLTFIPTLYPALLRRRRLRRGEKYASAPSPPTLTPTNPASASHSSSSARVQAGPKDPLTCRR